MKWLAHQYKLDENTIVEQTVTEHCRGAAHYAGQCLQAVKLQQAGEFAALVHDMGKFKAAFQRYLLDEHGVRGSVNHSFAAVRFLLERYHGERARTNEDLSAEILALAAGSHHGLFDCVDEKSQSGFLYRMSKEEIGYEECCENFMAECADLAEQDERFAKANAELVRVYGKLAERTKDREESFFLQSLLVRLILSAVIEGDRRDTAEFMNAVPCQAEPENLSAFWSGYLERVERKIAEFPQNTAINRARMQISDQCRAFAEKPGGVFRLNVPTGAGKTLSALRYALAHAAKWKKQRLIFTSPLLSILEQNAAVIREYVEDDAFVVEHHSNVVNPEEAEHLDLRELAVENWHAPIVITTLVQFLNTLFDGKTTSIRRFQALCNSIIVIDEVQTVPQKMLSLFNLTIDFLSKVCGATILLCSATQPCLEETVHPMRYCRGDLVPYDESLWKPFCRTVLMDVGGRTLEEIADFSIELLERVDSLLVVCNKKDEAENLFCRLQPYAYESFHLSAAMCPAHRREILEKLKRRQKPGEKRLCVATQVIEAGVDVSFESVIRLSAGLDNVIQAAGRCNRNSEKPDPAAVYVTSCLNEKLEHLPEIQEARHAMDSLLEAFRQDAEQFQSDLSSDLAVRYYYRKLYCNQRADAQDFYIQKKRTTLLDLMACNDKYVKEGATYLQKFFMAQALRTAGEQFQVFENATRDLVVPYKEGKNLIEELLNQQNPTPAFLIQWERKARPFTVSVYAWQLRKLGDAAVEYHGIAVLRDGFYDANTGLKLGAGEMEFMEV